MAGEDFEPRSWFDPVEQPKDPPDQRAHQSARAGTAQRRPAVIQPAEDLFQVLQFPAHDGYPVYLESLIGQVVDRAFGVGVIAEVAITWRAAPLGRTAEPPLSNAQPSVLLSLSAIRIKAMASPRLRRSITRKRRQQRKAAHTPKCASYFAPKQGVWQPVAAVACAR